MSRANYFRALDLARARRRKHRLCGVHHKPKVLCEECARVYCPRCGTHVCAARTEPIKAVAPKVVNGYRPTAVFRPLWRLVQPLGALRIEPHEDSGGHMLIFPPQSLGVMSAGELADKIWAKPEVSALAQPTAFRAGRGKGTWWVSFQLKETP